MKSLPKRDARPFASPLSPAEMAAVLEKVFFPPGMWWGEKGGFASVYCELEDLTATDQLWSWLRRNVSSDTRLVFHWRGEAPLRPEAIHPLLLAASVPVEDYMTVRPVAGTKQVCEQVHRGALVRDSPALPVEELSVADILPRWDGLLDGAPAAPTFYFTQIRGGGDLERIARFLSRRAPGGHLRLSRSFLEQPMQITNACQYGLRPCPATRRGGFANAVVHADGSVHPCQGGPGVGLCGTPRDALEESFKRIFSGLSEERHCPQCRRAGLCSLCPTLACSLDVHRPMEAGVAAFVELVRRRGQLGVLHRESGADGFELLFSPSSVTPRGILLRRAELPPTPATGDVSIRGVGGELRVDLSAPWPDGASATESS